jgi:hypothetical protein
MSTVHGTPQEGQLDALSCLPTSITTSGHTVLSDALDAIAVQAVVPALRGRPQPVPQPHRVTQQPLLLYNA